jgi:PAS domain S-box-containing protein
MVQRRRSRPVETSPIATLREMPAVLVLERFPIPALVLANDGTVLFANTAFADMLGHPRDAVLSMRYRDIARVRPRKRRFISVDRDHAVRIVELKHVDGSIVFAYVSRVTMPGVDKMALATFEDMTSRLWAKGALRTYAGSPPVAL